MDFFKVVNNAVHEGQLNTLLIYKADRIDNSQVHALSIGHTDCWLASDQHNQLFSGAPPPFCLHITYKNGCMNPLRSYLPSDMRKIRDQSRDPINYYKFQLARETMARIIAMGIKKQAIGGVYHRSRAGKSLFYRIHTTVTNIRRSANPPRSCSPTLAMSSKIKCDIKKPNFFTGEC